MEPTENKPVPEEFPKPSLTADIVLFTVLEEQLKVLLIQRGKQPYEGCWALPGGFSEPSETVTTTARRELQEETGVSDVNPHHFGIYSDPNRDPRGWVVSAGFVAFINPEAVKDNPPEAADDARAVKWAEMSDLPKLAFDHNEIIDEALAHVRRLAMNTAMLRPLFNKRAKTSEIDSIYQTVLGSDQWTHGSWTGDIISILLEGNELVDRHFNAETPQDDDCVWKD